VVGLNKAVMIFGRRLDKRMLVLGVILFRHGGRRDSVKMSCCRGGYCCSGAQRGKQTIMMGPTTCPLCTRSVVRSIGVRLEC
jgi:hypothetical protein